MNISLSKDLEALINNAVDDGTYTTKSEVVHDALRMLFAKKEPFLIKQDISWLCDEMVERFDALRRGDEIFSPAPEVFIRLNAITDASA